MTQIGEHGPLRHTSALDWNFSPTLQSQKGAGPPCSKVPGRGSSQHKGCSDVLYAYCVLSIPELLIPQCDTDRDPGAQIKPSGTQEPLETNSRTDRGQKRSRYSSDPVRKVARPILQTAQLRLWEVKGAPTYLSPVMFHLDHATLQPSSPLSPGTPRLG